MTDETRKLPWGATDKQPPRDTMREIGEREEAEADKRIMRDESLPIEERRAAFRRHNRRMTR